MAIEIGTVACESGTVSGIVFDEMEAHYGVETTAANEDSIKGVSFAIASGVISGLVTQIADGEVIGRVGADLSGTAGGGGVPDPHASSHQNGGGDEISVDGLSGLLGDAQTPLSHASSHLAGGADPIAAATTSARGTVELATSAETTAGLAVQASDTRLSDARTPTAHASSHENGGGDQLDLTGMTGLLGTAQTPAAHAADHLAGGADPIDYATVVDAGLVTLCVLNATSSGCAVQGTDPRLNNSRTPTAHASSHSSGGSDPVTVTNLAGYPGGGTTFLRDDGTFAAPAAGSSDLIVWLTPEDAFLGSNPATLAFVATSNIMEMLFSASALEYAHWSKKVPEGYAGGDVTITYRWAGTNTSTGNAYFYAYTRNIITGEAITTSSQTLTDSNFYTKSGGISVIQDDSVVVSNADMDSISAGDLFRFTFLRWGNHASDTYTGNTRLVGIRLDFS